ncbi:hypothetical protein KC19_2G051200 [Ceratodon purpureus]|uniref:Uncharacterized protein n=1 Tax=Ceratodon purpureus TaxID=3225 RepID=A0A8T0ISC6_CERPU|nr:hypothetical protein KC19_2G051200 [Ceratodon purpureus]
MITRTPQCMILCHSLRRLHMYCRDSNRMHRVSTECDVNIAWMQGTVTLIGDADRFRTSAEDSRGHQKVVIPKSEKKHIYT